MFFTITTIESHTAAANQTTTNRTGLDVSDAALSNWAGSFQQGLHEDAIDALELGVNAFIDGPAMNTYTLATADGSDTGAVMIVNAYGRSLWRLPPAAAKVYGRVNIPAGSTSRIQRKLGLHEAHLIVPAARIATVGCAGAGCPGYLELVRA